MMQFRRGLTVMLGVWALCAGLRAQEVTEDAVLRVRTRVVSLDALIKDQKTKQAIIDLRPENFEVLADGQLRPLSYFTREGDAGRKPLALALVFDLERLGAGRFLRRTEILTAMANELSKLAPADEVAVLVLDPNGVDGKREWLTKFTRNRAQLASALAIIPTLVGEGNGAASAEDGNVPVSQTAESNQGAAAESKRTDAAQQKSNGTPPTAAEIKRTTEQAQPEAAKQAATTGAKKEPARDESAGQVIDTFQDKDGHTVRRIVKPDGHIMIERQNKDGSVSVDMDDSDLAAATWELNQFMQQERPNSQAAVVYVTDGIAPMFYVQRDFIESRLVKSNVIFSALVVDMKTGFKFAMPILKPLGNWVGLSIAGSAQHFAKQTGGEVVKVHRPADYATGLAKIVGNLNARYSLGFTLGESERDDGQMHPLEVRVKVKDAKGRARKLSVTARNGYYLPKDETAQQGNEKRP